MRGKFEKVEEEEEEEEEEEASTQKEERKRVVFKIRFIVAPDRSNNN